MGISNLEKIERSNLTIKLTTHKSTVEVQQVNLLLRNPNGVSLLLDKLAHHEQVEFSKGEVTSFELDMQVD